MKLELETIEAREAVVKTPLLVMAMAPAVEFTVLSKEIAPPVKPIEPAETVLAKEIAPVVVTERAPVINTPPLALKEAALGTVKEVRG